MAVQHRYDNKKYIKVQTRKVISAYGGTGSIIETPFGALEIEPFDRWPLFQRNLHKNSAFYIEDERLLTRLNHKNGFAKLQHFIRVPDNVSSSARADIPERENENISASFFPKWFYCNKCGSFKPLTEWWDIWKNVRGRSANPKEFTPPKCGLCYQNSIQSSKRIPTPELEQVRFIMTSPDGKMRDIPWEKWTIAIKDSEDSESESGSIRFPSDKNSCCENQDLKYVKSNRFSDMGGIRVKCLNPECPTKGREVSLAGLFGLRMYNKTLKDQEGNNIQLNGKDVRIFYKPVIRTSNSVYYPILVSSIYLPTEKGISPDDQERIEAYLKEGCDINFIYMALLKKYTVDTLEKYIASKQEHNYEPEIEYRLSEYRFLTDLTHNKFSDPSRNLIFHRESVEELSTFGIAHLVGIKKLKITTVQTGYTRQEPLDKDSFLASDEETVLTIEAKYTSIWGKRTEYLPAIENYGEGIFMAFSDESVDSWLRHCNNSPGFVKRIKQLFNNCQRHDYKSVTEKFKTENHLARFLLVHTLSHILIKELEFLCGYPSTSLNERLFVDENKMQGLLIYTVAGSEGSFGGLVSQSSEISMLLILKSALRRAKDCASDPICFNTEEGQGIGGLNMAACYSCALLPENACEEFNSFLDRAVLVDNEFGFFKYH